MANFEFWTAFQEIKFDELYKPLPSYFSISAEHQSRMINIYSEYRTSTSLHIGRNQESQTKGDGQNYCTRTGPDLFTKGLVVSLCNTLPHLKKMVSCWYSPHSMKSRN